MNPTNFRLQYQVFTAQNKLSNKHQPKIQMIQKSPQILWKTNSNNKITDILGGVPQFIVQNNLG